METLFNMKPYKIILFSALFAPILSISSSQASDLKNCTYSTYEQEAKCRRIDSAGFEVEFECKEKILYIFDSGFEIKGSPLVFKSCDAQKSVECIGPTEEQASFDLFMYIKSELSACKSISIDKAFRQK